MPLLSMLHGFLESPRLQSLFFLLRLLLLLLIIGAMPSCGKDSWIKETPVASEDSDEESQAAVAVANPDEKEDSLSDYWKQVLQNLRVFPR